MIRRIGRKLLTPWLWGYTTGELGLGHVSWSQFGEDRLIERLFPDAYRGVYVDVGAFHPIYLSNSYAFYRKGWNGIAIDANPDVAPLFARLRPRDRFVHAAVGTIEGMVKLRRFEVGAFNCLEEHAAAVPDQFQRDAGTVEVARRPLASILAESELSGVDWFNVDCEGADLDILASNDWSRWNPKAVCVEDHSEEWIASDVSRYMREHGFVLRYRVGLSSVFVRAGLINE